MVDFSEKIKNCDLYRQLENMRLQLEAVNLEKAEVEQSLADEEAENERLQQLITERGIEPRQMPVVESCPFQADYFRDMYDGMTYDEEKEMRDRWTKEFNSHLESLHRTSPMNPLQFETLRRKFDKLKTAQQQICVFFVNAKIESFKKHPPQPDHKLYVFSEYMILREIVDMTAKITHQFGRHGCLGFEDGKSAREFQVDLSENGNQYRPGAPKFFAFILCGSSRKYRFEGSHPCGDPNCGVHLILETHEENMTRNDCHDSCVDVEKCPHKDWSCLCPSIKNQSAPKDDTQTYFFTNIWMPFDDVQLEYNAVGKIVKLVLDGYKFVQRPLGKSGILYCSRVGNNYCYAQAEVSKYGCKILGQHSEDCERIQTNSNELNLHFELYGMRFSSVSNKKGGTSFVINRADNGNLSESYNSTNHRCIKMFTKTCACHGKITVNADGTLAIRSQAHDAEECIRKGLNQNIYRP